MNQPHVIQRAEGKLAVLLPGPGAVSTTTMAGVFLARRGLASPTQLYGKLFHEVQI